MKNTLLSIDHIRSMTMYLYDILVNELSTSVCIETCLATIGCGYALRHSKDGQSDNFRIGFAWSSEAALAWLGGRGYVADPRIAYEAIARLEKRHVLWSRERDAMARLQRRHAPRISRPAYQPRSARDGQNKAA